MRSNRKRQVAIGAVIIHDPTGTDHARNSRRPSPGTMTATRCPIRPTATTSGYMFPDARIIVFAKAPVAGRVKTRLRPAIGAAAAARLYKTLCLDVLQHINAARCAPMELHVSPGVAHPWIRARSRQFNAALRTQVPGNLGQRMSHALSEALRTAPMAMVVGADCAGLRAETIVDAFRQLATGAAAVITPAEDGGYTLIGMRSPGTTALFRHIDWGTGRVLAQTRQRARSRQMDLRDVGRAWDVDDWQDVRRWRRRRSQ